MRYSGNNTICTDNKEIEVGKEYDYSEDGMRCRVKILEDLSNDEVISFRLLITAGDSCGDKFTFSHNRDFDRGAYNGMARFWDRGTYIPSDEVR